jgi:hypothetical protein
MSQDGRWTYNILEEGNWNNDDFETREEAIKHGREAALSEGNDCFFVGQIVPFIPSIDAYAVLDGISENACEECGESGEDYLTCVAKEDIEKLKEQLNKVLNKWLIDTGNEPYFWKIETIQKIEIQSEA